MTMGKLERMTISLPEEMVAGIMAAVQAGEFASTSEVIRDALRQWRRSRTVIALNDEVVRELVKERR